MCNDNNTEMIIDFKSKTDVYRNWLMTIICVELDH